jgi:hypothetical protein
MRGFATQNRVTLGESVQRVALVANRGYDIHHNTNSIEAFDIRQPAAASGQRDGAVVTSKRTDTAALPARPESFRLAASRM